MSSLRPGHETHAGQLYKLLLETWREGNLTLHYEAGLQWRDLSSGIDVTIGRGINRQICRAYRVLALRYRPGDRIILAGYSRGAYAVRTLAGIVDLVGLLRSDCADPSRVRLAYRLYQSGGPGPAVAALRDSQCHKGVEIEAIAVWDTVRMLGPKLPFLWYWWPRRNAFHSMALGPSTRHGFHALAHDETRLVYTPVLWATSTEAEGRVEQVWFPGTHGDVGGQLDGFHAARPLANLSLVWMLERLSECGLPLPEGWRNRFPCDPMAPSMGTWRGLGKLFLLRQRRPVGHDPSERLHPAIAQREARRDIALTGGPV